MKGLVEKGMKDWKYKNKVDISDVSMEKNGSGMIQFFSKSSKYLGKLSGFLTSVFDGNKGIILSPEEAYTTEKGTMMQCGVEITEYGPEYDNGDEEEEYEEERRGGGNGNGNGNGNDDGYSILGIRLGGKRKRRRRRRKKRKGRRRGLKDFISLKISIVLLIIVLIGYYLYKTSD